jgi:hypothetical protein
VTASVCHCRKAIGLIIGKCRSTLNLCGNRGIGRQGGDIMQNVYEKRKAARCRLRADMCYSFFNSEHCIDCKMLNKSPGGICFQTGYEIRPGTRIMIYAGDVLPDEPGKMHDQGIRARVCWCSNLPEFDAFFYKIGVVYE